MTRSELVDAARGDGDALRTVVKRAPAVLSEDANLRHAIDAMARSGYGIVPIVSRGELRVVGIISRSDVLEAEAERLAESDPKRKRA